MDEEKKKRFHVGMRLHIRDNLFGNAMVMNTEANSDSPVDLIEQMQEKAEEHINVYRGKGTAVSSKEINEYIKDMIRDNYSRKRIINHFAQFGIPVEDNQNLPPEKPSKRSKKIPDSQRKII